MDWRRTKQAGILMVLAICVGCSARANTSGAKPGNAEILPAQVKNWVAVTDFARQYPGNNLTISNDAIIFSVAGTFKVTFVSSYGTGKLFRIVSSVVPHGKSDSLTCQSKVSYLAITPGKIKIIDEPTLSFIAFDGKKIPRWKNRNSPTSYDDCGEFSYGAPLKN